MNVQASGSLFKRRSPLTDDHIDKLKEAERRLRDVTPLIEQAKSVGIPTEHWEAIIQGWHDQIQAIKDAYIPVGQ